MTAAAVAEQLRFLRIIWAAFLLAVVLYTPVPALLLGSGMDSAAPLPSAARSGLYFAALGAAVASFAARRWWSNSIVAALDSPETPARVDVWGRLRAGCVITWALSETVALIGVALALIARRPGEGIPLAVAAAVLLYLHRLDAWPVQSVLRAAGEPT